jgi:hypothetical protein
LNVSAVKSAPNLSSTGLSALVTQLDGPNQLVAGKEQALAPARVPRTAAYDGENGLKEKMLAIKEVTRSQYGTKSPQFLQIKGIRV